MDPKGDIDVGVYCHVFSGPESTCMDSMASARIISHCIGAVGAGLRLVDFYVKCSRGGNITEYDDRVLRPLIHSFSEVFPEFKKHFGTHFF